MAVVIGSYTSASVEFPTAATIPLQIGPNAIGDVVVICWRMQRGNTTPPTCPDFTSAVAAVNSQEASGILYHVNTSTTIPENVTVTAPSVTNICCDSYVIRGVAAFPIGATATSNNSGSSTATLAAARVTTTAANSIVIHSCGTRTSFAPYPTGTTFIPIQNSGSGSESSGLSGVDYVTTSGTQSPAFDFKLPSSANIVDCALEIKTDGVSLPVAVASGRTIIDHNAYTDAANTWYLPNDATIGITAIDGVSMGSYNGANTLTGKLVGSVFARRKIDYVTFTSTWEGKFESVKATGTYDLTDKVLCIPWARLRAFDDRIGPKGLIAVLVDSSFNWVAYTLRNATTTFATSTAATYTKYIKHGVTSEMDSGGPSTFDISSIRYIGYFAQGTTATSSVTSSIYLGPVWFENSPTVFTGGGSTQPINVDVINRYLDAGGLWGDISAIQGRNQYLSYIKHQIGDGARATNIKLTGQSFAFRDTDTDYTPGDGDSSLTLKGSASCVFDLSAAIVLGEAQNYFTIDSASSTSAAYNLTGASFINLIWASDASIDYSGASFDACNLVEVGGGTITNATVTSPSGTSAATVSVSGATLDGCSLTAGSASYHLTLGTTVTAVSLNDVVFNGTPATDKIHVLKTTGTVTITTSGTTSLLAADVASEGATVVIAAPELYQSVTVSNLTVGSRVQIYDTTSATELSNSIAAGTSVTWTDTNPASASRDIRVRIAYVSGATAKEMIEANIGTCGITEGTEVVSYLANQVADSTYNTNAIDGSTVTGITIDDSTDLVKIAIAGGSVTWPQIYAYQVYWLNTSTGIQDDFAFIEAPDTANYLLTGFKIKNTSSPTVPLVISSGYGRDSTTGASVDLVDTTGGTLIFAPDHVVAFSSGSGLTAGQDSKLSAIETATAAYLDATVSSRLAGADYDTPPTASDIASQILTSAQSTPIYADIHKVTGATITGAGTESNPWGP